MKEGERKGEERGGGGEEKYGGREGFFIVL